MIPKKHVFIGICTVLLFISLISPIPVGAASVFYVSLTGSDANPGSQALPFRTIQKGVNSLTTGSTLYIRGGTYTEKINVSTSNATITAYPGEIVIMDGTGLDPSLSTWTHLVNVSGSYNVIQDLELTYPKGRGVWTTQTATHNTFRNLRIHHMDGSAYNIWGSYNTVENNRIWKTNLVNDLVSYPGGDWPGVIEFGDTNAGHGNYGSYTTVRNNRVYDNYGEGIICEYSDNALIEGNVAWDNWAGNIYLDSCSYATLRNNLAYYTTDHEYWRFSNKPAAGIEFSNEGIIAYPLSHDVSIYNNIIVNAGFGIFFWSGFASGSALINDTIAYNTIVNNYSYGFGLSMGAGPHQNTLIANNLVSVMGTPLETPVSIGLIYSHNLWSKPPALLGIGDIVANPLLSDPLRSLDASVDPAWYKLTPASPAIGRAFVIPGFQLDYHRITRGLFPDIGAYEFRLTYRSLCLPLFHCYQDN